MYDADKVRELNDVARHSLQGCRVMVTRGVAALDSLDAVLAAVRDYSDFNSSNDPYGEHDFGSFAVAGERFFFGSSTTTTQTCRWHHLILRMTP